MGWGFVGGMAGTILDQRKVRMAEELRAEADRKQKEFQKLMFDMSRAERTDARIADQSMRELDRLESRFDRSADAARQDKIRSEDLKMREREFGADMDYKNRSLAASAADRKASRQESAADRKLYREETGLYRTAQQQSELSGKIAKIEDRGAREQAATALQVGDIEAVNIIIATGKMIPDSSSVGIQY